MARRHRKHRTRDAKGRFVKGHRKVHRKKGRHRKRSHRY